MVQKVFFLKSCGIEKPEKSRSSFSHFLLQMPPSIQIFLENEPFGMTKHRALLMALGTLVLLGIVSMTLVCGQVSISTTFTAAACILRQ